MSTRVMFTGVLPFVVVLAALLAVTVSFFLLALYRRAVRRGMNHSGGADTGEPQATRSSRVPASSLEIRTIQSVAASPELPSLSDGYRAAKRQPWAIAAAYAVAGLVYAAIMTTGWLAATHDTTIVTTKVILLLWTYVWPAAIAIMLIIAYDRLRRLQLFGTYFAVLLGIFALALARNPDMTLGQLAIYWIIVNAPETVLVFAFLVRPIRAVGPLVLAFMTAVAIGSQSILSVAQADEGLLRAIANVGFSMGLNATAVFVGMILSGMVLAGLLGWPLLKFLGRRYEQKKMSDQSLMLDSLWLVFGVVQSISLAFEGALWILTGFVAFAAYKATSRFALTIMASRRGPSEPKMLLLLRVFALGKRSEALFDKLRKHWPYAGALTMIAGPDLVTATVEPHEFLEFVSGRLSRQFVSDRADLESRIAAIDTSPDPDGRRRIVEFFCRRNIWQRTMERLAGMSDAVLMDLRSFTPSNTGCVYELGRLLDSVDLSRVVFIVDHTTDREFLDRTLQDLWRDLEENSPNRSVLAPAARLFYTASQSEREIDVLLRLLFGAAETREAKREQQDRATLAPPAVPALSADTRTR